MPRNRIHPITQDEADLLITRLVRKTREHPLLTRGAGVRAALSLRALADGYRILHGRLSRNSLKKAALIALPHRVLPGTGAEKNADEIILEIVRDVIFNTQSLEYDDPFRKHTQQPSPDTDATKTLLEELVVFQNNQHRGTTRVKNLHAEYVRRSKSGENIAEEKLYVDSLHTMLRDLEAEGILSLDAQHDGFSLHGTIITRLLSKALRSKSVKAGSGKKRELCIEKAFIRNYKQGDTSRDVSPRHTLRRLIRKGKKIDAITTDDLRCFERVPVADRDIAICIDVSDSMRASKKLYFAKIAAAGMARTAIQRGEKVGIVLFSNTAECVVPLTDNTRLVADALLTIRAGKYTNTGAGIKKAREMLLKKNRSNRKLLIVISDGLPNLAADEKSPYSGTAHTGGGLDTFCLSSGSGTHSGTGGNGCADVQTMFRNINASRSALKEVEKSRRNSIEGSYVFIGSHDDSGRAFAQKMARLGGGSFLPVATVPDLPGKALSLIT